MIKTWSKIFNEFEKHYYFISTGLYCSFSFAVCTFSLICCTDTASDWLYCITYFIIANSNNTVVFCNHTHGIARRACCHQNSTQRRRTRGFSASTFRCDTSCWRFLDTRTMQLQTPPLMITSTARKSRPTPRTAQRCHLANWLAWF